MQHEPNFIGTLLKCLISFTCIPSCYYVYKYYEILLKIQRHLYKNILGSNEVFLNIMSSPYKKWYILELIITLLHVPAGLDFLVIDDNLDKKPFLTDKINIIIFLRLYLLFRWIRDSQLIYKQRNIFLAKYPFIDRFEIESYNFNLKYQFNNYPLLCISSYALLAYFIFSFIIYVAEREKDEFFTLESSLWFTFCTMTTVGYGEYVVEHDLSRFIAMLAALNGITLAAIGTGVVANSLTLKRHEIIADQWIKKQILKKLQNSAASLIYRAFELYLLKKKKKKF